MRRNGSGERRPKRDREAAAAGGHGPGTAPIRRGDVTARAGARDERPPRYRPPPAAARAGGAPPPPRPPRTEFPEVGERHDLTHVHRAAYGRRLGDPLRGTVRAWLFGIAHNLFRHHLRDDLALWGRQGPPRGASRTRGSSRFMLRLPCWSRGAG